MGSQRKIIHIDMDAFFASVEQRDRPQLRRKPLIVGGNPWCRGVVSTCSYEARVYGVHSAMPTRKALELCPHALLLPPRMEHYAAVSREIFAIFSEFTDLVEPLSCDEAFLDVTGNFLGEPSATRIARLLRRRIWQKTGLTASAGVSYNLFLAKVASGMRKPNGLSVIPPESAAAFIDALPVHKFYGIGRVTAEKLATRQIFSGADLKRLSPQAFRDLFGKTATYYERILRGEDDRPVCPHRDRKSLGRETTFPEDLKTMEDAHAAIHRLAGDVATALQMENLRGRTLTLKVRYGNFESITRSQTFSHFFSDEPSIAQTAETLLHERTQGPGRPIRLLGISVSEFQPKKFTARFVRSALVQGEFAFQDA